MPSGGDLKIYQVIDLCGARRPLPPVIAATAVWAGAAVASAVCTASATLAACSPEALRSFRLLQHTQGLGR